MPDATPFRSVLRGYDPAQVDQVHGELSHALEQARREAADRTVELSQLHKANQRLQEQVDNHSSTITDMQSSIQEEQRRASAPSFSDLGERIGKILSLADAEAEEMRAAAREQVDQLKATVEQETGATRALADRYVEDRRGKADSEAASVVERAKREADQILDEADREAAARREEGEAFWESQRAKAAQAAADFEATLGARRDKAADEFTAQMAAQEKSLTDIQARSATLAAEAEQSHSETMAEIAAAREKAQADHDALVVTAREKAERIRRDSERELAAATARRDSITAQLSNVRQMLSTLGGAAMVETLDAATAPVAAPAEAEAAADEDEVVADDQTQVIDAVETPDAEVEDDVEDSDAEEGTDEDGEEPDGSDEQDEVVAEEQEVAAARG